MVLFFLQVFFMKPRLGKNGSPPPKLGFDKLLLATFVLAKTTTNEFPYFFLPLIPLLPRAKKGNGNPIVGICQNREFAVSSLCFRVFGDSALIGSRALGPFLRPLLPLRSLRDLLRKRLSRGAKKYPPFDRSQTLFALRSGEKVQYADAVSFRNGHFLGIAGYDLGPIAERKTFFVDFEKQCRLEILVVKYFFDLS